MLWRLVQRSHYLLTVGLGRVGVAFRRLAHARRLRAQRRQIRLRQVQMMLLGRRWHRQCACFLDGRNGKWELSILKPFQAPLQIPRLLLGNDLRPLPLDLFLFVLLLHLLQLKLTKAHLLLLLSLLLQPLLFKSLFLSSSLLFLAPPAFFLLSPPFFSFTLSLFFKCPLPF